MRKEKNNFTKADKDFTFTLGSALIKLSLVLTAFILIRDLVLVLTSYGSWGVFGQKLVISFIFNIALIATVKGKIGINTDWMQTPYYFSLKKFIFIVILSVVSLVLLVIGVILVIMIATNKEHRIELLIGMAVLLGVTSVVYYLAKGNKSKALHYAKDLGAGIMIGIFAFTLFWGSKYIKDIYKNYMYGTTNDNDIVCIKNDKGLYIDKHEAYEGKTPYPYAFIYACTDGKVSIDIDYPSPD